MAVKVSSFYVNKVKNNITWSARTDAIKTMAFEVKEIKDALNYFHADSNQKSMRVEAKENKLLKTDSFQFSFITVIWNKILPRINENNQPLRVTWQCLVSCIGA